MTHSHPDKATLRREAKARLAALSEGECKAEDEALLSALLRHPAYRSCRMLFTYVSVPPEADTRALIAHALSTGKRVCVPRTVGRVMECREIRSLAELAPDARGIPSPTEDAPLLPPDAPDLCIVPCLAATKEGDRLGHGGGCYDRFLPHFSGTSLLLCRRVQLLDRLPREPHDCICHHCLWAE